MTCMSGKLAVALATLVLALSVAPHASAQVFTGRVDVTVEDATGGRLPGVNVDLTGPVNQSQVSDTQGQARFLNLPVGTYTVKTSLSGFNPYTNTEVVVAAGSSTPLNVRLSVAGTAETVNVTAATPIIDTKRTGTSTTISLEELQNIPSGRDPWVVMQTVPGIIVDRVNVGGSESGQQSGYQAKGAIGGDATWNLDGVPITDMSATGATPTYWDFDMFQEMNVTTGGSDMTSPTGGVHLSFVLKSGQQHGRDAGEKSGQPERQRQPDGQLQGLRLRAGRADHQGSAVGVGIAREDRRQGPDDHSNTRSYDPEKPRLQGARSGQPEHSG